MNVCNFIGNIGKSAEVRHTPQGDAVAQFSLAIQSGYGKKAVTTWLTCNIWGKRAETLAPMILKGSRIGVTGELTNRQYKAQDGTERYSLDLRVIDVTLLGSKSDKADTPNQAPNEAPSKQAGGGFDDFADDIPFN